MVDKDGEERRAHWQRVEEIYRAALPLAVTERAAFVAHACAGDDTLYEDVASQLAVDDAAVDFRREPVGELGLATLADERLLDTESMPQQSPLTFADLEGATVADR